MRNLMFAALTALLFFGGAVGGAQAADFEWVHFGTDPAYPTHDAAMADRANVFKKFGYSESQVACLVAATAKPGTVIRLNVGDRLMHMLSGHGVVHANTVIAFVDAAHGIEYTALAEEWTVACDGVSITVDLPEICNNWSDRIPVPIPTMACATLRIHIPAGKDRIVRSATLRHGPITDFNCWGIIAGQYREGAPRNCDTCVWTQDGLVVVRRYFGLPDNDTSIGYYNISMYEVPEDATSGNADGSLDVIIVVPIEAEAEGNGVCIEVDGATYPAAVILPGSWKRNEAEIPLDFWANPRIINPP